MNAAIALGCGGKQKVPVRVQANPELARLRCERNQFYVLPIDPSADVEIRDRSDFLFILLFLFSFYYFLAVLLLFF